MEILTEKMGDWELDRKQSTPTKLIYRKTFQRVTVDLILEREDDFWHSKVEYISKNSFQIHGTLNFQRTRNVVLAFEGASQLATHFANDFAGRWF